MSLFIADLTYIKSLDAVDSFLDEHVKFLDKHYASGNFICSGRKTPRTGGIILIKANDEKEVESIISQDPFYQNNIAKYNIVRFEPTKFAADFQKFVSN